ncbi:hypothetical protein BTO06_07220 [Tenacibaculum sp. SZ-18]|nr:hypothetical protein BTO06_07220 [Tenacibaculum sp. SZ-18]
MKTYKYFDIDYYPEHELLLWKIKSDGIPNFSLEGLKEFTAFANDLKMILADNGYPLKYIASSSMHPEVYNMGGDLPFFFENIINQNREVLTEYAHLCIEVIHNIYNSFGLPAISIALVEGNAYGGGFECVAAHDIILANNDAKFCLPENKFNLFPGMGAYSFLFRKLNFKTASDVLYNGDIYDASQMKELGLVNQIFKNNRGIDRLVEYINKTSYNFIYNHHKCLKRVFPLQKSELIDITDIWVDACLNLDNKSLRRMELIINAQNRKLKQKVIK